MTTELCSMSVPTDLPIQCYYCKLTSKYETFHFTPIYYSVYIRF